MYHKASLPTRGQLEAFRVCHHCHRNVQTCSVWVCSSECSAFLKGKAVADVLWLRKAGHLSCFCYWFLLRAWESQIRSGSRSVSSFLLSQSPQVAQGMLLYPVASTYEVICSSYPSPSDWLWSLAASFAVIPIKYWNHSCGVHQNPVEMIPKSVGCQASDMLSPVSRACHTQEAKLIEWGMV